MEPTIHLDVAVVLQTIAELQRVSPQAAQDALSVLRLILNREAFPAMEIFAQLSRVNLQLEKIMALQEDLNTKLAALDASTTKASQAVTAIGARITSLEAALANLGLTPEQQTAIMAHLDGVVANTESLASSLEQMGQAPAEPVPVEPPPALPAIQ